MKERLRTIDIRELVIKCRSKHEMYIQMTVNGKMYLPNESDTNNHYIYDIIQGQKK